MKDNIYWSYAEDKKKIEKVRSKKKIVKKRTKNLLIKYRQRGDKLIKEENFEKKIFFYKNWKRRNKMTIEEQKKKITENEIRFLSEWGEKRKKWEIKKYERRKLYKISKEIEKEEIKQ